MAARARSKYCTPAQPEQALRQVTVAPQRAGDRARLEESPSRLLCPLYSLHNGGMHAAAPISIASRGPAYAVTVSEVLHLALPSGSEVVAGKNGMHRGIFWARLLGARQGLLSGSEAGEMVLLTASAVGRGFQRVVRDLGEAGVEAILVTMMPPSDAIEAADELGMPILRVLPHSSLIEVERAIISLIVDKESQVRRRVEQIYERLLATLVDDTGIQALAAEVAAVARRPTIVLDEYFRVQVTVPDDEATQQIGHDVGTTLAAGDPRALGARPAAPFWLTSDESPQQALVVPLRLRGTPAGYLVLGGPGDVTDLDRQVAERAARVLGIELAKQRAVTEAQLRLQGDFLDDLLSGSYPSEEAMQARARWMGHDLGRPHVLLAVSLEELAGRTTGTQRLQAADVVRTEVLRLAPGALLRERQDRLAVALPRNAIATSEEALELAERLRQRLASLLTSEHVTIGVGRYHPGIGGLATSYREAEQALAIGRALLGGDRSVHFEHLGVQRLLFQLRDNPELASFYEDLLGKLQAHDERQGAELVNTLEAFFECHGNHVRTAQRLHLHRNTLLYRLDRAKQVLGADLDDAETRLALQVALKIGRVIGRRGLDGPAGPPA
jgi:PucR family transcriptional regulator, purine catabolism regulatory protein